MFDSQSSQEFFSRSLVRMNNPPNADVVSSNTGSDYWSQPSSQEENLQSYGKRPLLFTRREKFIGPSRDKNMQFYDMQHNRLAEINQKMVLSTVESLTNHQTKEMKECLDSLRSVLSCELKTSIQEVNNTVNDSDGYKKMLESLEDMKSQFSSVEHLKKELEKKEAEIAVKDTTIQHLEDQLKQKIEELNIFIQRDVDTIKNLDDKLEELLNINQCFGETFAELKENGKEFKVNINHLLKESMSISEQSGLLLNKENIQYSELTSMSRRIDELYRTLPELSRNLENVRGMKSDYQHTTSVYSASVDTVHINPLNTSNPHFHIHPSSSSSSMMNSYKQPVSFLSPKPLQPRISSSGPYARPSPTAVVLPRVMEKTATIKQEFEPRPVATQFKKQLTIESDIFEVSSDSDSTDNIANTSINQPKKKKSSKSMPKTRSKRQKKQPQSSVTTDNITKDTSSKPSTPVQRSIKRYCKIKKSSNPFSTFACAPNKNNEIKNPKSHQGNARPSRCSLALKRKQENVFNFNGDDDDDELIQFCDLLKSKYQKRSVQKTY